MGNFKVSINKNNSNFNQEINDQLKFYKKSNSIYSKSFTNINQPANQPANQLLNQQSNPQSNQPSNQQSNSANLNWLQNKLNQQKIKLNHSIKSKNDHFNSNFDSNQQEIHTKNPNQQQDPDFHQDLMNFSLKKSKSIQRNSCKNSKRPSSIISSKLSIRQIFSFPLISKNLNSSSSSSSSNQQQNQPNQQQNQQNQQQNHQQNQQNQQNQQSDLEILKSPKLSNHSQSDPFSNSFSSNLNLSNSIKSSSTSFKNLKISSSSSSSSSDSNLNSNSNSIQPENSNSKSFQLFKPKNKSLDLNQSQSKKFNLLKKSSNNSLFESFKLDFLSNQSNHSHSHSNSNSNSHSHSHSQNQNQNQSKPKHKLKTKSISSSNSFINQSNHSNFQLKSFRNVRSPSISTNHQPTHQLDPKNLDSNSTSINLTKSSDPSITSNHSNPIQNSIPTQNRPNSIITNHSRSSSPVPTISAAAFREARAARNSRTSSCFTTSSLSDLIISNSNQIINHHSKSQPQSPIKSQNLNLNSIHPSNSNSIHPSNSNSNSTASSSSSSSSTFQSNHLNPSSQNSNSFIHYKFNSSNSIHHPINSSSKSKLNKIPFTPLINQIPNNHQKDSQKINLSIPPYNHHSDHDILLLPPRPAFFGSKSLSSPSSSSSSSSSSTKSSSIIQTHFNSSKNSINHHHHHHHHHHQPLNNLYSNPNLNSSKTSLRSLPLIDIQSPISNHHQNHHSIHHHPSSIHQIQPTQNQIQIQPTQNQIQIQPTQNHLNHPSKSIINLNQQLETWHSDEEDLTKNPSSSASSSTSNLHPPSSNQNTLNSSNNLNNHHNHNPVDEESEDEIPLSKLKKKSISSLRQSIQTNQSSNSKTKLKSLSTSTSTPAQALARGRQQLYNTNLHPIGNRSLSSSFDNHQTQSAHLRSLSSTHSSFSINSNPQSSINPFQRPASIINHHLPQQRPFTMFHHHQPKSLSSSMFIGSHLVNSPLDFIPIQSDFLTPITAPLPNLSFPRGNSAVSSSSGSGSGSGTWSVPVTPHDSSGNINISLPLHSQSNLPNTRLTFDKSHLIKEHLNFTNSSHPSSPLPSSLTFEQQQRKSQLRNSTAATNDQESLRDQKSSLIKDGVELNRWANQIRLDDINPPIGVDPFLYSKLSPQQKAELNHRTQLMMQSMAAQAQAAANMHAMALVTSSSSSANLNQNFKKSQVLKHPSMDYSQNFPRIQLANNHNPLINQTPQIDNQNNRIISHPINLNSNDQNHHQPNKS